MMTVKHDKPLFGCELYKSWEGYKPDRRLSHVGTFWVAGHTRGIADRGDQTQDAAVAREGSIWG